MKTGVVLCTLALAAAGPACGKKSEEGEKEAGEASKKTAEATPDPEPKKTAEELLPRANELAHEYIIVDGHIDLPYRLTGSRDDDGNLTEDVSKRTDEGDFDYVRAKEGGLDAPFMSIYVPAKYQKDGGARKLADELIDLVESLAADHPDKFAMARSPDEIRANTKKGLVSLPLGIENGAAIEKDLANLEHFYDRGVRYITLTHSKDNAICDSSYDDSGTHGGLTDFGEEVVREMNRLGIMVDISHVSDEAFAQVLEVTEVPVIASHSSLRHFVPDFERNMSDQMVKELARNGGVVMINFGSTFVDADSNKDGAARREEAEAYAEEHDLDRTKPKDREKIEAFMAEKEPLQLSTVEKVADHIERVVDLVGVDHVGFGSDFDGVGPTLPKGLEDPSKYPRLIAELMARGFSEDDIAQICHGNIFRVWKQVSDYAAAQKK